MAGINCICGNQMEDSESDLPYMGRVMYEESFFDGFCALSDSMDILLSLKDKEQRAAWIKTKLGPKYPTDHSDSNVMGSLLMNILSKYTQYASQCKVCGRIWFAQAGNKMAVFKPENENNWNAVFTNQTPMAGHGIDLLAVIQAYTQACISADKSAQFDAEKISLFLVENQSIHMKTLYIQVELDQLEREGAIEKIGEYYVLK